MSERAPRCLRRMNALTSESSSPAPGEVVSSRTEPINSRRRRVLRTGELFHFDLDSPLENVKKFASQTKSVDKDTPLKKRAKTPSRSMKKINMSAATDSARKTRKSIRIQESSKGKNTDSKECDGSVSPNFKTFNVDVETPPAEENLRKITKSPFRSMKKNAHITTDSNVASSSKKNSTAIQSSLLKLNRRSVNHNTENTKFRLSGVKLFKSCSSDVDSVQMENTADSSQAEILPVDTQKRKSTEIPLTKKIKTATTPKYNVDSPKKGQNSVLVHQSFILKRAGPLDDSVNSQIEEKNFVQKPSARKSLPVENAQPKRKIVRAKRLLNHTANQLRGNESAINTVLEVQTSLKKKRKTWQRQENFDMDSFCELINDNTEKKDVQKEVEVIVETSDGKQDATFEVTKETSSKDTAEEIHTKDVEIIEIIDLVEESGNWMDHTEEQKQIEGKEEESKQNGNTFELVVTTFEEPISPSTTNPDSQPLNKSLSPFANLLHFDSSKEEIMPSTSGLAPETTSRRRTYELENSVNDVSVLKTVSEQDSIKINSFSSGEKLPDSDAAMIRSKVTVRRRFDNNDEDFFNNRISKITPPWMTEEDADSEKSSPETSTPMPVTKGRFTLLKEVLTRENPVFHNFKKNVKNFEGLGLARMSTSLVNDNANSTNKKKQTPHLSFRNYSAKKQGSKVKVPNFAAIHKRALEKVENISEYKKRKEDRARMLLSGKKPTASQTPKKQSKKQLRFDPTTFDNPKPVDFIPLPSTPLPKRTLSESMNSTITPVQIRVPKFNFVASKENLFSKGVVTPKGKEKGSKSNAQWKVLTPKNNNSKEVFRFGNNGNRFGFNVEKPAVVRNKEEMKSMIATKSKGVKNVVQSRRVMIKGVRSNRRFELLMNMRKGK